MMAEKDKESKGHLIIMPIIINMKTVNRISSLWPQPPRVTVS